MNKQIILWVISNRLRPEFLRFFFNTLKECLMLMFFSLHRLLVNKNAHHIFLIQYFKMDLFGLLNLRDLTELTSREQFCFPLENLVNVYYYYYI